MNRDRLAGGIALAEVVALEHPRNGPGRGEPDEAGGPQLIRPLGIEQNLGAVGVEDLEYLVLVGLRVLQDLLARERRACRILAAGVTYHPGEIADEELDMVAQVLKLPQLVDHDRVSEMQVGCSRVHAELHPQWTPGLELVAQLGLHDQLVAAA